MLVSVFCAVSQQTNITVSIQTLSDQSKLISWNSVPGAFYTIESAETLDPSSLAQLQWARRETGVPSQGTNTVWIDVGDPSWIPRLPYPELTTERFYQVSLSGTNALVNPTITMSLYTNGVAVTPNSTIGGFLEVRFTVTPGTSGDMVSKIIVLVDGEEIPHVNATSTNVFINTTEWPNAPHNIWVEAITVDSADTTPDSSALANAGPALQGIGLSSQQAITFNNYIYDFLVATPYFEPDVDGPQEIVASFQAISYWYLFVVDGNNNVINYTSGTGSSLYAAWWGTNLSGDLVSDGFYNYIIEARPTNIGPFNFNMVQTMAVVGGPSPSAADWALEQSWMHSVHLPPPHLFFQHDTNFVLPPTDRNPLSLAPQQPSTNGGGGGGPPAPMSQSSGYSNPFVTVADGDGNTNYFPSVLFPPGFDLLTLPGFLGLTDEPPATPEIEEPLGPETTSQVIVTGGNNPQPMGGTPTTTQTTSTPLRISGEMFKGFAGVFGTAYQGHHISWQDVGFFSMPTGGSGWTSTWAPYGKLKNASVICNGFTCEMVWDGWRSYFQLADEGFRWPDLTGCFTGDCVSEYGQQTAFGGQFRAVDFGLLVGHMVAASGTALGAGCAYYPFWNPTLASPLGGTLRSYSWIALPQMDFGQSAQFVDLPAYLKWMALYGCNSLRLTDVNDMWTKFLLPFPGNMRILLGSGAKVQIAPIFGTTLAGDINGTTPQSGGSPMSIISGWDDAGKVATLQAAGTRNPLKMPSMCQMTHVFRDKSDDGSTPGTYEDSIWNYQPVINLDYTSIDWDGNTVYSP